MSRRRSAATGGVDGARRDGRRKPIGRWRARLRRARARAREIWKRIRGWRRIHFTRGGALFTAAALAVGFAAMNTGNNLLFLLLGAMLGTIVLSGWLSERAIGRLEVRRRTPRGVAVGEPARISYEVRHGGRWLPSLAVEIREEGLPGTAFVNRLDPGGTTTAGSARPFVRRGVYPLDVVTLSTGFPFGLFRKERDLRLPDELVVWPRTDRRLPTLSVEGEARRGDGGAGGRDRGARGEYRGLRPYRVGDDPRDVHWRSTARVGEPVVREYERESSEALWICLDLRGTADAAGERAVEAAASLAARFHERGRPFALAAHRVVIEPASGDAQLERVLDALARVELDLDAPVVSPPVHPRRCVLVSSVAGGPGAFGDAILTGDGRTASGDAGEGDPAGGAEAVRTPAGSGEVPR